ncbi:tannase/feruloyl esterase family alpha/beta hydrolase [Anaeromyxobacter oryzisoli]|uniref:tannase/feruloyl esterase family alpha/beta hydrolase n=1 Tax=Anaeromyxobacter oryzisoli TaxID=2925408 RepID=UPI001F57DBA9|nr:tannase/feruloyl esterase family alpha/beta hydrolase [Anaeromyxobacter sp. SG63]
MNVARKPHPVSSGACWLLAAVCALATLVVPATGLAAATPCTAEAAQAAAPPGMTIGRIDDLNPALPAVPTGARAIDATGRTPSYCLVTGSVVTNPSTGKTANFGVALPLTWSGRFLFTGCGGLCGSVFQSRPDDPRGGGFPADALAKGYAIAATDDGHANRPVTHPFDASWAITSPGVPNTDARIDYFHRAVHTVTEASKLLVQRWYSGEIAHSYFFGCSNGGREGMVEATRYPTDFDGYVVGDPFFDVPGQILAGGAALPVLKAGAFIPPALLALVNDTVRASCDALDGVEDGLIQNPGRCSFEPRSLICKGGRPGRCLTQGQVDTLTAWLSAKKDEQGRVASFGFSVSDLYDASAPGANLYAWVEGAGPPRKRAAPEPWGRSLAAQPPAWSSYDQAFKYLVYLDPSFDNNRVPAVDHRGIVSDDTLGRLVAQTDEASGDDPRALAPFLASKRKLIMYHGYSDGFVNPFRTIRFYEDWAKLVGGYDALKRSARLFMVPGMYHCDGGPGPNTFDALGALERWVEDGVAPEGIVATKYAQDDRSKRALRTMPLCSFPTQARHPGRGDVNSAEAWSCAPNRDLLLVGPNGAAAGLDAPMH